MPLHMETQHDKTTHHAATHLRPRTLCRPLGMQQASKHEQNTEKLYMQKSFPFHGDKLNEKDSQVLAAASAHKALVTVP